MNNLLLSKLELSTIIYSHKGVGFYSFDLEFDPMTLVLKLNLGIEKCICTQKSAGSKVIALTEMHRPTADRQRDGRTHSLVRNIISTRRHFSGIPTTRFPAGA